MLPFVTSQLHDRVCAELAALKLLHAQQTEELAQTKLRAMTVEMQIKLTEAKWDAALLAQAAAEQRYHALAEKITAKAFAPPPEPPQTHVVQPAPSAEYQAMHRINESTINRMIPDLVSAGLKPEEARNEAERIVLAMDSIADPAGLTMLEGVIAPRSNGEGPT